MYKNILKQAWRITWQCPFLWFFGLFATLLWGNEISLLIKNFNQLFNWFKNLTESKIFIFSNLGFLSEIFSLLPWSALISFFILTILGLLFIYLANFSIGAIIFTGQKMREKEKVSFRHAFKIGVHYSLIILLVNFLAYLIIYGLAFPQKIPGFQSFLTQTSLTIPLIIMMIVFTLFTVIISFLSRFTICAIVLEKKRLLDGLKRSGQFLIKNYRPTLVLAFYLFLISLLVAVLIFLILAATSIPFFALSTLFHQIGLSFLFKPLSFILFFISLILVIFLGSVFSAYQIIAWTLFFLGLKSELTLDESEHIQPLDR